MLIERQWENASQIVQGREMKSKKERGSLTGKNGEFLQVSNLIESKIPKM